MGFLYADGGITLDKRTKGTYRFKIEVSIEDEILIDNFSMQLTQIIDINHIEMILMWLDLDFATSIS